MTEVFTQHEHDLANTFYNATDVLERVAHNNGKPMTLVSEAEDSSLPVDSQVVSVLRGVQRGSAHELIDGGLGGAVIDIFKELHHG